jgi:hypothetical protein
MGMILQDSIVKRRTPHWRHFTICFSTHAAKQQTPVTGFGGNEGSGFVRPDVLLQYLAGPVRFGYYDRGLE